MAERNEPVMGLLLYEEKQKNERELRDNYV